MKPDPALSLPASRSRVLAALRNGATLDDATAIVGSTAKAARDLAASDGATAEAWQQSLAEACADGDAYVAEKAAGEAERIAREAAWAEAQRVSAEAETVRIEEEKARLAAEARARPTRARRPWPPSADDAGWGKPVAPIATPSPPQEDGSFDLARVAVEAAAFAPGPFGFFLWVDARRIVAGFPPISNWWRHSIGEFYASGKPWGFWCVGRGGGKSTTLECVAATDSFFGMRKVHPGQTWTWPFISVGPDDANRRINGIAAVYRAIGLPIVGEEADGKKIKRGEGVHIVRAPRGALDLLDARGNEIQLASIAGTIGNISGPSTIGLTIDEAAKLHDKAANANPLTEIIASGAQTSRARTGWRAIVCSSAWEKSGAHFQLIDAGDNDSNYVARIGAQFIDAALHGFEVVASYEEARGDKKAAAVIRAHARTLNASSPLVPTWVANDTLGHPDAIPWEGAALASRKLVEVLPERALDGMPRSSFWLRENGSVPMNKGAGESSLTIDDMRFMAAQNRAMNEPMGRTNAQRADDYMRGLDDDDPRGYRGL